MIFDVLKGVVLIVFTVIIFVVGFFAEAICTPIGRIKEQSLINDFISKLWKNSYKYQFYITNIYTTYYVFYTNKWVIREEQFKSLI